jgi:hypothetical protein
MFELARSCLSEIGKVTEEEAPGFVRGSTRIVLQKVHLKINIVSDGARSVAKIDGLADDIWGGGARMGIRKLIRSLEARMEVDS